MFNLKDVKSTNEPLPPGLYGALVTNSEFKSTKNNDGEYLNVEFTITDKEYTGRKVFQTYNLINKNPTAVNIALQQLKSLLIETGCDEAKLGNLDKQMIIDLIAHKKVGIRVKIQTSPGYDDKNVVSGYKAIVTNNTAQPNFQPGDIPF